MGDIHVFRVQSIADGRGPFRPGMTKLWAQPAPGRHYPLPWYQEFGMELFPRSGWPFGSHFGCACRSLEGLRVWFTASEYATLQAMGYHTVRMDVQRILAESVAQVVFQRVRALTRGVEAVELYGVEVAS